MGNDDADVQVRSLDALRVFCVKLNLKGVAKMPDIEKLLGLINAEKYKTRELLNLYANTVKYKDVSEMDRERIIEAVELQIRKASTREANKLFPKLYLKPKEALEALFSKVDSEFDLSENTIKNGVKTGGPMISGKAPVNVYVSYKAVGGRGVVVGAYQWALDEPLKYRVFAYQGMNVEGNERQLSEYDEPTDDLVLAYCDILKEIVKKK